MHFRVLRWCIYFRYESVPGSKHVWAGPDVLRVANGEPYSECLWMGLACAQHAQNACGIVVSTGLATCVRAEKIRRLDATFRTNIARALRRSSQSGRM